VTATSQTRTLWSALAGVPLLFAAIASLQVQIDARTQSVAQEREELLMRSGAALKKLSVGYDSLLADIYWTRAVQYYGARVGTQNPDFSLLWPLLDLTTTLDPKLVAAYRFGAIFLSEKGAGGAGRADLAIELVKRGIASNPDVWQLDTDLGFLYYWRLKDYPNSAAAYLQGSKNPKAPVWLKLMAARVAEKGGSTDTSALIWSEIYQSNNNPSVRKFALQQLRELKVGQDEAHLDDLIGQYRKRFGHYPSATNELVNAKLLPGIPVDPAGVPYVIGPDGKSKLDPRSPVAIETSRQKSPH